MRRDPSVRAAVDAAAGQNLLASAGRALLFVHLAISPLVFSAQTVEVFEYNKVAILLITAILLLAGAAAASIGRMLWDEPPGEPLLRRIGRTLREPIALGMVLFFISAAISTVFSINRRTSFFGAHESFAGIITMAAYLVLFLGTRSLCKTPTHFRILLFASASVAVAGASLYGFMQLTGLDPIKWGRVSNYGGIVRVFATMGHPNFLSAFLAMAFPIVVYFAIRAFREKLWVPGAALALIAALDAWMVLFSISRGAWLALGAAIFVMVAGWAFVAGRRPHVVIGWVLALTIVAMLLGSLFLTTFPTGRAVLESVKSRAQRMTDTSALTKESRGFIWAAALEMFRDKPATGVGLDGFQLAFEQYRSVAYWESEWNGTPTKAHNEALHILATQGVPGALATLVITAGIGIAFYRAVKRRVPDRWLLVAVVAGCVAFYVQNVFSFTVAGCGTLFITFAALLSRLGESSAPYVLPPPASAAPRPRSNRPLETHLLVGGAQAAIFAIALAAIYGLVVRPFEANAACRNGASYMTYNSAKAVEFLNEAVRIDPTKELYWVRLGTANQIAARASSDPFLRRALLEEARKAYQRSIDLVPENSYNWANLGRLLGEMAKENPPMTTKKECYAAFEKALAIDPNNAYFYSDAGNAALGFYTDDRYPRDPGDRQRALVWATRCAQLYASFGPPHSQLGYLSLLDAQQLTYAGRSSEASAYFDEAVRRLERALAMEWHGDSTSFAIAASNLAAALIRTGRFAEALQAAHRSVSTSPDYADAHFNQGKAYEMLDQLENAHASYVRVLQLNPAHAMGRETLKALRKRMQERGLRVPPLPPGIQPALD